MNFAPKVGPLVAELLSGFTIVLLAYFALSQRLESLLHDNAGIAIAASTLIAWLVGSVIDAFRNLVVEEALDHWWFPINWECFINGPRDKIAAVEEYFFSFYRIDMDMAIAVSLFLVAGPPILSVITGSEVPYFSFGQGVSLAIVAFIFIFDARSLRCDLRTYLK